MTLQQTLPRSAEVYARRQRAAVAAATAAVRRRWRRMGVNFDASWMTVGPQVQAVMDEAQRRAIADASAYMPAVLAETGAGRLRDPEYALQPDALVGVAGDGRATAALGYGAVVRARQAVEAGETATQALATAGRWLTKTTGTLVSDTGRTVEKVTGNAHGVTTYVRMLNPPSCGRCVILAGETWGAAQAFERHPGCDCRNIPAPESMADDLTVHPGEYLHSLPSAAELAEQYPDLTVKERRSQGLVSLEDALGSKGNAQAYRDGADMHQLINAYRRDGSVQVAQARGRSWKYTAEGTTRRGFANTRMQSWSKGAIDARGRRIVTDRRLMPETIYANARNRAEALQMLRMYGWVL